MNNVMILKILLHSDTNLMIIILHSDKVYAKIINIAKR